MDDHGHGTHCAGTIGAIGNNGVGVTGVSWRTKIMALKFISRSGSGFTSDAMEAVAYATTMKTRYGVNVRVTSNSWGGGGFSSSLRNAIQASNNAGILYVAAAGNDARDNDRRPFYPASYDNAGLIAVASSDHRDALSGFSNYGRTSVDLAAPGSAILSTLPGNRYGIYSGTSMATPHVAGAAALLLSSSPSLSATAVKSRLIQTVDARPAFANRMVSGGRLNVHAALLGGSSVPAAPTNLNATAISASQVSLTWRDNANNEQGFRIERKVGTGRWAQIAEVPANTTSYANGGLTRNTSYRYRVRAFNSGGTSAWATSGVVRTPR
jgi:subtilisin family serine protease